ncbi:hypothetical protein ECPA48_1408, partial [Escherichia coli PA48]
MLVKYESSRWHYWYNPIEYLHQSHNFRLQRKYR